MVDVGASVGTIDRDIGSERLPAFAAKGAKTSAATVAVVLKFSVQFPNFIYNYLILECALPYGKSRFPRPSKVVCRIWCCGNAADSVVKTRQQEIHNARH